MDDFELLQSYVKNGSEEAFSALVEKHAPFVLGICQRRLQDPHLAEDAVQGVFWVLARKAKSMDEKTVLPAWLAKTAKFVVKGIMRKRGKIALHEPTAGKAQPLVDLPVAAVSVLDEAIEKLPAKEREAVYLHYLGGHTQVETARKLQITERAVQHRLAKALDKLKRYFSRMGVVATPETLQQFLTQDQGVSVSSAFSQKTVDAALGKTIGTAGAAYGKGAMHMMFTAKLAKVGVAVVAAAALVMGGSQAIGDGGEKPKEQPNKPQELTLTLVPKSSIIKVDPGQQRTEFLEMTWVFKNHNKQAVKVDLYRLLNFMKYQVRYPDGTIRLQNVQVGDFLYKKTKAHFPELKPGESIKHISHLPYHALTRKIKKGSKEKSVPFGTFRIGAVYENTDADTQDKIDSETWKGTVKSKMVRVEAMPMTGPKSENLGFQLSCKNGRFQKQVYYEVAKSEKNIDLDFVLFNLGKENIQTNAWRPALNVRLEITDPQGKVYKDIRQLWSFGKKDKGPQNDIQTLKPYDALEMGPLKRPLAITHQDPSVPRESKRVNGSWNFKFYHLGTYAITAYYHQGLPMMDEIPKLKDLWRGSVKSNTITLKLVDDYEPWNQKRPKQK